MAGRVDAGGRDRHLPRLRLHGVHHVLRGLIRRVRIDAEHRDVGDVEVEPPVADLGVEQAADDVGAEVLGGARGPGVAVRRRHQGIARADRAGRARLVDDDDLLPERLLHLGRGDARHLVGRAAGGPRHDDGDRLVGLPRIVLRRRGAGECRDRGCGQRQDTKHENSSRSIDRVLFPSCVAPSLKRARAPRAVWSSAPPPGPDRAARAPGRRGGTARRGG